MYVCMVCVWVESIPSNSEAMLTFILVSLYVFLVDYTVYELQHLFQSC